MGFDLAQLNAEAREGDEITQAEWDKVQAEMREYDELNRRYWEQAQAEMACQSPELRPGG